MESRLWCWQLASGGLLALFVASRGFYWVLGVHFDASALSGRQGVGLLQLLDLHLLKTDLLSSLWHLHSQPPLFNLYCGFILKLPAGARSPFAWATFMAIGYLLVVSIFLLLRELGVTRFVAIVVAAFVALSPTYVLYENFLFYAYPSAALLTMSGWLCARFFRTKQPWWGVAFAAAVTTVGLMNSTYQLPWLLTAGLVVIVVCWGSLGRRTLLVLLPLLVFVGWLIKNEAMFGTLTSSSWIGMNLSNLTVRPAEQYGQLQPLIRSGEVDRYAATKPWQPFSYYVPAIDPRPKTTGVPALDLTTNSNGQPNLNNTLYLQVSSRLLRDDLRYIEARPGQFLRNATVGAMVWFAPPDQYALVYKNWTHVRFLTDPIDRTVGWQPNDGVNATFANYGITLQHPTAGQLSYSSILLYGLDLIGTPLLLWRRRHNISSARIGVAAYMWCTIAYGFVLTSLVDVGENNRFRLELGALPAVLGVYVGVELLKAATGRRVHARGHQSGAASARRNTIQILPTRLE